MVQGATFQDRMNETYSGLSIQMQAAARYVSDNPVDIATRSLRSVASSCGASPATFSRLARALGYLDYEEMREERRVAVERKISPFSDKAAALQASAAMQAEDALLRGQAAACVDNIETLTRGTDPERLRRVVDALDGAGTVLLVGSMGSAGLVDYMGYMGQWFQANWKVAGRNGIELGATLARLTPGDVLFALVKQPYARRTMLGLKAARERGVKTIVLTDSSTSPALQFADHSFIVPTDSPQFFSSYAATLVLMEAIISMLIARVGHDAEEMIRAAEQEIERLGENWSP